MRRLPVLQSKAAEDGEAEARPDWHWVLIGGAFVVTLFLPLAIIAAWLGWRLGQGSAARTAFVPMFSALVAFAFAAAASGAMVGRFGGRRGVRIPSLGGTLGGAAIGGLAALSGSVPLVLAAAAALVLCGAGALFGALGARIGLRSRPK